MERKLYPLKFEPILKDKIWGGPQLRDLLNKSEASDKCGESWEISGVDGDVSVVSNGWLKGNNLGEIIEIYMGDFLGEEVYNKFGTTFPLLIKFIGASDDLSIQVHPDDEVALERHQTFGKTEMWYVMNAEDDARLAIGFNRELDKKEYLEKLNKGQIMEIVNYTSVQEGDVFFIPSGRLHAIGKGVLLAEIQQTSDITYRIFDYERKDDAGNARELHTDLALEVLDFQFYPEYHTKYEIEKNSSSGIIECRYFKTNIISFDKIMVRDYSLLDSFVILICVEGESEVKSDVENVVFHKGETILIPADMETIDIVPKKPSKILEVYIKS